MPHVYMTFSTWISSLMIKGYHGKISTKYTLFTLLVIIFTGAATASEYSQPGETPRQIHMSSFPMYLNCLKICF